MRMLWSMDIANIGSQSRKIWLIPNIARKHSPMTRRLAGKPSADISSNLVNPPDNKFIKKSKNKNDGTKPYQNFFSRVASSIPLPAKANPSSHFLQFIYIV